MKPVISIYDRSREEALEVLRNRAENEAQNAQHAGIDIPPNKFYESFLKGYEEDRQTLREGGKLE